MNTGLNFGLVAAFMLCLAGASEAISVDRCAKMIQRGKLPVTDDFCDAEAALRQLPYHDVVHAHPYVQGSLEFTALYMCAADDIVCNGQLDTVDIIQLEKSVLNMTINITTDLSTHSRRSASDDRFFDGLLSAFADNNGISVHTILNEVTNGWWNCLRNAANTARELYRLFVAGTGSFLDTIHRLANAIVDCISAATNSSPVGWLRRIWQGARLVLRATSIARDCGGLWSTYQQNGFNSYAMGRGVGTCINTIAARRRRELEQEQELEQQTAPNQLESPGSDSEGTTGDVISTAAAAHPVTVPDSWTCDPNFYYGHDGCDVGCGAYDLDCSNETQHVHYKLDAHIDYVPPNLPWDCPAIFFNGSDGCDMNCSSWDPDCGPKEGKFLPHVHIIYWNPQQDFDIIAEKSYENAIALASGNTNSNANNNQKSAAGHTFSSTQLGLLIAGTVLATMVICTVFFAVVTTSKKSRVGHRQLTNDLITNEDEGDATSYSLH